MEKSLTSHGFHPRIILSSSKTEEHFGHASLDVSIWMPGYRSSRMALPMSNCVLTFFVTHKLLCCVNLRLPSLFIRFCLAVRNASLLAEIVDETAFWMILTALALPLKPFLLPRRLVFPSDAVDILFVEADTMDDSLPMEISETVSGT